MAWTVGSATQVSVHSPASTIFFLPVFWTAATKFLSSHEFMEERSIGVCSGKMAWICGHMFPLNPLVSTVLRTTGTPKTRAALQRISLLLMMDWRSKLPTPKSICGCRSMMVTTQLSGVSNPFSLRLASEVLFGIVYVFVWFVRLLFDVWDWDVSGAGVNERG